MNFWRDGSTITKTVIIRGELECRYDEPCRESSYVTAEVRAQATGSSVWLENIKGGAGRDASRIRENR